MTLEIWYEWHGVRIFNSHPHKEDDYDHCCYAHIIIFSTHILTRRMTASSALNSGSGFFNSHPHKEDDLHIPCQTAISPLFNSHPHKEDDYLYICFWFLFRFFNSHPHKEDDGWLSFCRRCIDFSTHILTRRMTCRKTAECHLRQFFNSHPHKEDDSGI